MNKVIAFVLVALLGGGGISVNQMLRLPDREELRKLIQEETSRAINNAAEDAAQRAAQRVLQRQQAIEARIDSRIDELYRRVDALAPYAAAIQPIMQKSTKAMQEYRKVKNDGFEALEETKQ
jgi:Asp-tRNA(Asn)/Glu-tRNA(Gln) amidotransferase A subunit family amidase